MPGESLPNGQSALPLAACTCDVGVGVLGLVRSTAEAACLVVTRPAGFAFFGFAAAFPAAGPVRERGSASGSGALALGEQRVPSVPEKPASDPPASDPSSVPSLSP